MNRISCLIKYCKNKRIYEYEKILKVAKQKNYKMVSLENYLKNDFSKNDKILILRHDIDHKTKATAMMITIEHNHNATASYYFRECTADIDIINKIKEANSEASFHFETIANFIKYRKLLVNNFKVDYLDLCKKLLKYELESFRIKYNIKCKTIASHGELINRKFEISNNVLTEDINDYKLYNIDLEAYNSKFISDIKAYISDCPIEINNGYRYGINPIDAIENNLTPILFLSHPNHWYYTKFQIMKKIVKLIIYGVVIKNEKFKRISK